jgi:hypothetical protein
MEDEAMPGDPRDCRQRAQECLRLAQEAATDSARQDYEALANTWTQLANMFESDDALAHCLSVGDVPLETRTPPIKPTSRPSNGTALNLEATLSVPD